MITVGLPTWNNKNIVWLAMESLTGQVTTHDWELIVFECKSDNECGEDYFVGYNERLAKAGCVNVTYLYSKERLPLGMKWKLMSQKACGDIFLLQGSDDFSAPNRIQVTRELMKDNDWYDTRYGYQYSFAHDKIIEYDLFSGNRKGTGFNMAIKTSLLRTIPDNDRRRGVDHFIYTSSGVKTRHVDQQRYAGVATTGLNTISYTRVNYFETTIPPFQHTKETLDTIGIPEDIIKRIRTTKTNMNMTISVSMIVRNSADVLQACLESVKDADEIVILDTGSTDNTRDIALKYTDKYFENEYAWKDDFADARNYAKNKCTCTHILTIDADEVLEDGDIEKLRAFSGRATMIRCVSDFTGEIHWQPRLYRNAPEFFWKGKAHNYLTVNGDMEADVTIRYGTNKQKRNDPDRTMRILRNVVKTTPAKDCPREMYYLAKEYHKRGWFAKTVKMFKKYLTYSQFTAEKVDAYILMSRALLGLGKLKEATNAAFAAAHLNPDCAEALALVGDLSTDYNRLRWKRLSRIAGNKGVLFVRPDKRIKVTLLTNIDEGSSRIVAGIREASMGEIDIEMVTTQMLSRIGENIIKERLSISDIIHFDMDKVEYFGEIKIPDTKYVTEKRPIPHTDFKYSWRPGRKFRILHISINQEYDKTQMILEAAHSLNRKDVEITAMQNVPLHQKWQLLENCDIYIDSFGDDFYSPLAIDAMSRGVPVIAPGGAPVIAPGEKTSESIAEVLEKHLNWDILRGYSTDAFKYAKEAHGESGNYWVWKYKKLLNGMESEQIQPAAPL